MDFLAPLAPLVIAIVAYVAGSMKIINEGDAALVERFGRFRRILNPGLNFTIPVIDTIIIDTTREQVFDVPAQDAITADDVYLKADAVVFWRITNLRLVHYEVDDIKAAIESIVLTALRDQIGHMALDKIIVSREEISKKLLRKLDEVTESWGVKVTRVEVKDIKPSEEVLKSLDKIRTADSEKQAAVSVAQGKQEAMILEAESRRQAAIAEAQGIVEAVKLITSAIQQNAGNQEVLREMVRFLVAQRYVDASQKIGESANSKIIFMDPRSLTDALDELVTSNTDNLPGTGRQTR
ncbi:MAG: SPFH domain-containing protein [Prochlorotrichaceae cyanobacterium]|jgi:regulator of protease activity HflC (stomatin/prohibitin superfamily)